MTIPGKSKPDGTKGGDLAGESCSCGGGVSGLHQVHVGDYSSPVFNRAQVQDAMARLAPAVRQYVILSRILATT